MKRLFPAAILFLAAISCCKAPVGDRLLLDNKEVKGIEVVENCIAPEGIPGMTVREIAFVN